MPVNDGGWMEERQEQEEEMERGGDFRGNSVAPMSSLNRHDRRPSGGSVRRATNAAANEAQRLFSPRSTAAMALSSISQTFSMGSETAYESKSNESSHGSERSPQHDERLPFLPSVSTTKMSAPPPPPPPNPSYRCVTEPSPSSARNPYHPPSHHHHHHPQQQPPQYSSSPSIPYTGTTELYHKNDKHRAPPYSTPDVNTHLERSFAATSSDPVPPARSHGKPTPYPPQYPPPPPQMTPSLPSADGNRRVLHPHYPPPPNDPYHPRMVSWHNPDPSTMQWVPYPPQNAHHPPQPHPSLMIYPCYPMQPSVGGAPHGNFGMVLATAAGHLPPTPVQSYVTPTPHKKAKLLGEAPPSLPYHVVVPPMPPHNAYSHVKAPPPPPTQHTEAATVAAKPVVEEKYNRKNKSLGVLAETFLKHFTNAGDGHEIVIDQLAAELAVERRRIYDVVNILEALQVVVKVGKNTYHWMGREHLVRQFALLQQEGIALWPERAAKSGLVLAKPVAQSAAPRTTEGTEEENVTVVETKKTTENKDAEMSTGTNSGHKSLTRLSQMFLQIFLIGTEPVSLPEASDMIHGKTSSPEELVALGMKPGEAFPSADTKAFYLIATRGLKTKIRRLYDIANVFLSIGLLRKSEYRRTACPDGKRPHYHFQYHLSLQAIREAYDQLPVSMIENLSPFNEEQLRILQVSSSQQSQLNFFSLPPTNESPIVVDSSPLLLEHTAPSPATHLESYSHPHRNSTDASTTLGTDNARSAAAESPSSVGSVKTAEEDEHSPVVGPMQSTPWTDGEESRAAKNFQVTPTEENHRNSSSEDPEDPCFQAMHVLVARPNDASPRRVSLSSSCRSM